MGVEPTSLPVFGSGFVLTLARASAMPSANLLQNLWIELTPLESNHARREGAPLKSKESIFAQRDSKTKDLAYTQWNQLLIIEGCRVGLVVGVAAPKLVWPVPYLIRSRFSSLGGGSGRVS